MFIFIYFHPLWFVSTPSDKLRQTIKMFASNIQRRYRQFSGFQHSICTTHNIHALKFLFILYVTQIENCSDFAKKNEIRSTTMKWIHLRFFSAFTFPFTCTPCTMSIVHKIEWQYFQYNMFVVHSIALHEYQLDLVVYSQRLDNFPSNHSNNYCVLLSTTISVNKNQHQQQQQQ